MSKRLSLVFAVLWLAGCSSMPQAAKPGAWVAGAVVGASLLFYLGVTDESSAPPEDVGCFDKIEGNTRQTICPP